MDAKSKLCDFIGACELVPAGKETALLALQSAFKDKEDALQYYTALRAKADYSSQGTKEILKKKHKHPTLPVYLPDEFFKEIN